MSYGPGRSPFVTGVVVGVGVWLVGFAVAAVITQLIAVPDGFSDLGFAAAIYVTGAAFALVMTTGQAVPIAWVLPMTAGLLAAVAGGAVVVARTSRQLQDWTAVTAGASVALGVCLCTLVVLAVYLVPSTPVSNLPVSFRYVSLLLGNLLGPALFGALGGAIQHSLSTGE